MLVFESHGTGFAAGLVDAIKKASSSIPVAVQPIEQGVPDGTNVIQAVILPSSLAIDPPEALRVWLKNFTGFKLVIPINQKGWYWVSADSRYNPSAAAQIIRQLSEGQEVRATKGNSALQTTAFVFAILFGIQVLFMIFGLGLSLVTGGM